MPDRPTVRSTPWPVSETPVPPPAAPAPAAPVDVAEPVAAELPEPRQGDRVVQGLLLLAVLLVALAAGLGAAAVVEHRAHPSDGDAWLAGALAAAVVLVLAGTVALLRRPKAS